MQPPQGPGRHDQLRSALPGLGHPFLIQGFDTFYDVLQIHFKVPPEVFCFCPIFDNLVKSQNSRIFIS
jgi:hypothetical protein